MRTPATSLLCSSSIWTIQRAAGSALILLLLVAASARGGAAQCATVLQLGFGGSGTNGTVYATAAWDPDGPGPMPQVLVVGGSFSVAGTVAANNIACFEPIAGVWSALGTGTNNAVVSLMTLPNGTLVAGGTFSTAGGVSAGLIAQWDGVGWSSMGTGLTVGLNSAVGSLARLPNGDLVAGGSFTVGPGPAATNLARWDGTSWSSLGWVGGLSGSWMGGPVACLATFPNGDLAVGSLQVPGGIYYGAVSRWNGANWQPLGSFGGISYGLVNALAAMPNGDLVVGGYFWIPGGLNISRWNGTSWVALGLGISSPVQALAVLPNGDVLATAVAAGGVLVSGLARWDGQSWSALAPSVYAGSRGFAALSNGDLVVNGSFSTSGPLVDGLALLSTTCPATAVSLGSGCTGSGGLNALTATSLPWTGATCTLLATGFPGNSLAVGVRSLSTTSLPLSAILPQGVAGCLLLVGPDLVELQLPTSGSLSTQIAIPNSIALAGQVFHDQVVAIELDPLGDIAAMTSTNALSLTIGVF